MITHNTATGVPNRVVSQDPVCFSASRFRRRRQNAHLAFHKPLCHYERVHQNDGTGEAASWRDAISTSENAAIPQTRDGGGEPCPRNSRNSGKIDLHSWQEKWNSRPLPLLNCRIGLLQRPPTPSATGHLRGKAERTSACRLADSFKLRGVCFVFSSDSLEAVLK